MQDNESEGIRIQKVLANAGIASRRAAEKLIQSGKVTLNGQPARLGQRMKVGVDHLMVEQQKVRLRPSSQRKVYALYKPKNCITSLNDPQGRPTVKDFFPKTRLPLFPIGRLDYDAEGLLLLTNDGDFAQRVIHPKYKLWKTYFVKIKGLIPVSELIKIRKGLQAKRQQYLPARAKVIHAFNDKSWLEVSLQEGKNQQIKNMFKALGYRVLKIKRYRIDCVTLDALEPGMSRLLSPQEINQLLKNSEAVRPKSLA